MFDVQKWDVVTVYELEVRLDAGLQDRLDLHCPGAVHELHRVVCGEVIVSGYYRIRRSEDERHTCASGGETESIPERQRFVVVSGIKLWWADSVVS